MHAKNIVPSLMGLDNPLVLALGGVFGVVGYALLQILGQVGLGSWRGDGALTVITSAILVMMIFGKKGVLPGL